MRRLLPPILVVLCAIVMLALFRWMPAGEVLPSPYNYVIGVPLILAGLGFGLYAARQFSRVRTNIKTFDKPNVLVTDGAFRFSRNPMYLGFAIALLGFAIKLNVLAPFLVVLGFVLITHFWYIRFEERMAGETFGEAYEDYRRKTRRWI
jgi:protein-S-isoprenylcysteine O-methyltransferase Ste14